MTWSDPYPYDPAQGQGGVGRSPYDPAGYASGPAFAPVDEYARPGGRELAPAVDRLVARIVDILIVGVPVALVVVPLMAWLYIWFFNTIQDAQPDTVLETAPEPTVAGEDILLFAVLAFALGILATLLTVVVTYVYEVVYMPRTGQTVGKRLMRICVVRVDDGGPVTVPHARRRWLAQDGVVLLNLIPFAGTLAGIYRFVDMLWLLWDKPYRQCLHDKYGRTAVVTVASHNQERTG